MNIFLRAMRDSTEMFYIQPFAKDLFKAIKQMNKKTQKKGFTCFRGGYISPNEVGQIS